MYHQPISPPETMGTPAKQVTAARQVHFRHRTYLARRGERPVTLWLIEDGWAICYKMLRDGRRHISRLYLPGDLCDPTWLATDEIDQMVISSSPVQALAVDRRLMEVRLSQDSAFASALAFDSLSRLRAHSEWLITLGCKSASERLGQFFCELYVRLQLSGRMRGDSCDFPLSQQDVAEFTGMTPVHVCRTLRELRLEKLIELRRRKLHILDFERLSKHCGFDDRYLKNASMLELSRQCFSLPASDDALPTKKYHSVPEKQSLAEPCLA